MKEISDDIDKTKEEAGEPTLSDREIYEMERKGEEILADMSMTEERGGSATRETAAKNHLIEEIKEKGMEEGSETRKLWDRWILDQEAHTGAMDTSTADIESFRERASVLRAAGLLEEALDELDVALEQAFYDDDGGDAYEAISTEMDKIEDEIADEKGIGEDE
ncbi:MAG: hypothetical protein AAB630_03150 [Patescibacteria group bacterium]